MRFVCRDRERDRESRRQRRGMWDDTGGASEQDVIAAQAQQVAMTQMWAAANPTMMHMGQAMQPSGRKQRELYVGNLAVGVVNGDMLKEFFTSILTQCEGYSPTMGPPVAVVQLSGEGKFAFVEFRDELIAVTALQLDKVELAGRALNVGRPAGFVLLFVAGQAKGFHLASFHKYFAEKYGLSGPKDASPME